MHKTGVGLALVSPGQRFQITAFTVPSQGSIDRTGIVRYRSGDDTYLACL